MTPLASLPGLLGPLYGPGAPGLIEAIRGLVEGWKATMPASRRPPQDLGPADAILITYADSLREAGVSPLKALGGFLGRHGGEAFSAVHLLPLYPATSDDGFSVVDYRKVDPDQGSWEDVAALAARHDLMLDAVVNHVSASSPWFTAFTLGDPEFRDFFIRPVEGQDYSRVVRPRTLPLFTEVATAAGSVPVWTTFSTDQVDLNFREPRVLLEVLDTLLFYAARGARYLRLDAVGFVWKEAGTTCLNLPGAHALVKVARAVLDAAAPGCRLITETNVPHAENLAYFGSGDEAHLVYQFPLPPLVLHALVTGRATALSDWVESLGETPPPPGCAWFNFLASHDGIGLRPLEGLLPEPERDLLVRLCLERGGQVGYRSGPGGEALPYELNVTYMDALCDLDAPDGERLARFLAAHAILLGLAGVPGIYLHSLLGSRNWTAGVAASGIARRINREKLEVAAVEADLSDPGSLRARTLAGLVALLRARAAEAALGPGSPQAVLRLHPQVLALRRGEPGRSVLALVNLGPDAVGLSLEGWGADLLGGPGAAAGGAETILGPYEYRWLREAGGS